VRRRLTFIVASVAAVAVLLAGGTAAVATQTDDADSEQERVTGAAGDQARAAGLKEAGGGTVVEMERDPEGQRIYKVEVRRANGTTVDVNLNSSFEVVPEAEDDANEANERDDNDDNEPNDRDDNDADDRNDTDD
jgi:peptidase YpeB-like protein